MSIFFSNAKIDSTLLAAINAAAGERSFSNTVVPKSGRWELILFYSGDSTQLEEAFPDFQFTFLLSNYAIVQLTMEEIPFLAASPDVIYIESPKKSITKSNLPDAHPASHLSNGLLPTHPHQTVMRLPIPLSILWTISRGGEPFFV